MTPVDACTLETATLTSVLGIQVSVKRIQIFYNPLFCYNHFCYYHHYLFSNK